MVSTWIDERGVPICNLVDYFDRLLLSAKLTVGGLNTFFRFEFM